MEIQVNGVRLWYEKAGKGPAIVLLHGNGESHAIFSTLIGQLSSHFTVYAPDSRGHGKSEKTPDLDYDRMAEDIAAFIRALKLDRPILYGFSDGGIIGLLIASKYPGLLSRLAISGANTEPDGVKRWALLSFRVLYFFARDAKINMMLTEPHITRGDLAKIQVPVLVLAGEKDLIRKEHTEQLAANIQHAQLRIVPKESHSGYVVKSPKLYAYLRAFIETEPSVTVSSAGH